MKILVVDDEPVVLRMMVLILTGDGYEVVTATHAGAALQILDQENAGIELVISDVTMPGTSGFDLATRIAGRPNRIPVILMSGYSSQAPAISELETANSVAFIAKPFLPKDLLATISDMMDRRENQNLA